MDDLINLADNMNKIRKLKLTNNMTFLWGLINDSPDSTLMSIMYTTGGVEAEVKWGGETYKVTVETIKEELRDF